VITFHPRWGELAELRVKDIGFSTWIVEVSRKVIEVNRKFQPSYAPLHLSRNMSRCWFLICAIRGEYFLVGASPSTG
jgi:hypothetical protein